MYKHFIYSMMTQVSIVSMSTGIFTDGCTNMHVRVFNIDSDITVLSSFNFTSPLSVSDLITKASSSTCQLDLLSLFICNLHPLLTQETAPFDLDLPSTTKNYSITLFAVIV